MDSVAMWNESHEELVGHLTEEKESTTDRLQRQVCELENRVDKYLHNLENVEEMCEQARTDIKRFQVEANETKEIVKKDADVQPKLFSALSEMNEKVKRMEEKDATITPLEGKLPDAATQNALRYTTSAQVRRYIKIGCALIFDTVAAYALCNLTKPLLF